MKGIVTFFKSNMEVVDEANLFSLPYKRELVIKKSIELFSEPNPCVVYETASCSSLAIELSEILPDIIGDNLGKLMPIADLKEKIGGYIDFPKDSSYIKFI